MLTQRLGFGLGLGIELGFGMGFELRFGSSKVNKRLELGSGRLVRS